MQLEVLSAVSSQQSAVSSQQSAVSISVSVRVRVKVQGEDQMAILCLTCAQVGLVWCEPLQVAGLKAKVY